MKTSNTLSTYLKSSLFGLIAAALISTLNPETAKAQSVDAGFDLYSTYVWRGVAYSGPSLQPYVEFSTSGFAIGAWGSQGYDGFQEMDLYAGYEFDFGLSLGVTDYWYPGAAGSGPWLDGDSHAYELNLGYGIEDFSLSANYIFAGSGSAGDDIYFEAGYSITDAASVFLGAGDGWHSSDTEFALVNIGVSAGKEIEVTESFSIPLTGSVIFNPDTEQLYILAGISF